MSEGDQFMSSNGIRYLLKPKHENMDAEGKLHPLPHVQTFLEPECGIPS